MYRQNESGAIRLWLLVVLLIVILGGAGYFGWHYYWSQNSTNQLPVVEPTIIISTPTTAPTPIISPTPLASPTATASPTVSASIPADWKTYTDSTYNFTFKYPSNWSLQKSTGSVDQPLQVQLSSPGTNGELGANFTITIDHKDSVQDVIDVDVARYASSANFQKSTITFAGVPATEFSYDQPLRGGAPYISKGIIFASNGNTIVIGTAAYATDAPAALLDQVANTFQLVQ